ncbi:MAG: hypothetical protein ABIQ16_10940 [Polyangiaceae bacterium]
MRRISLSTCALSCALALGCSSSDQPVAGANAAYDMTVIGLKAEIGEVVAFNAKGAFVSVGGPHGLAITDSATRVWTTASATGRPIGFDDDGDLLYRDSSGRARIRHGADGPDVEVPQLTPENFLFSPFALAPHGVVWGLTSKARPGEAGLPGFGAMKDGVLVAFHDWGTMPPGDLERAGIAANEAGQVLFVDADTSTPEGNGFQKELSFVFEADGTVTDLNGVYGNSFRVGGRFLNARGQVAGSVLYGDDGLGGNFGFLYDPPTGYRLGEEFGDALFLNDTGDVIYLQTKTPRHVLLRRANGDKVDLTPYLRDSTHPNAEVSEYNVVGLNASGEILIVDELQNIALLAPK